MSTARAGSQDPGGGARVPSGPALNGRALHRHGGRPRRLGFLRGSVRGVEIIRAGQRDLSQRLAGVRIHVTVRATRRAGTPLARDVLVVEAAPRLPRTLLYLDFALLRPPRRSSSDARWERTASMCRALTAADERATPSALVPLPFKTELVAPCGRGGHPSRRQRRRYDESGRPMRRAIASVSWSSPNGLRSSSRRVSFAA